MVPQAYHSQRPKRHLDRFSRFAGLTNLTNRHTHTHTHTHAHTHTHWPRYSVCSNRPLSLAIAARQPSNDNNKLTSGQSNMTRGHIAPVRIFFCIFSRIKNVVVNRWVISRKCKCRSPNELHLCRPRTFRRCFVRL